MTKSNQNTIYVLGSINTDFVISVDHMPKQGETMHGKGFLLNFGGKGANQAIACSNLGLKTKMLGSVGQDSFGEDAIQRLLKKGIDTTRVLIDPKNQTGMAFIIEYDNDNRIILNQGANKHITQTHLIGLSDAREGDILIAQLETPFNMILEAFKIAKTKKMITILNAAPATAHIEEIYSYVDYLIINQTEAEVLSGIYPENEDSMKQSYRILAKQGITNLIITLGEAGSVYIDSYAFVEAEAFKINPVDTTGAGDAFIGAFVYALLAQKDIREILSFANSAGSFACMRYGAEDAMGSLHEIEEFIKESRYE